MDYIKFNIPVKPEQSELILAFLSQLPFEAFEEKEEELIAWLAADLFTDEFKQQFSELKTKFNLSEETEVVHPQNWNAIWEANHQPIRVGDFCQVRADFHPAVADVQYDIIINPKMAFGTGHHETTYMMMDQMKNLDFKGSRVLDLGCGTGVLAFLARMMGASDILAIDNDPAAYQNTLENLKVNDLQGIRALRGSLKDVDEAPFDYILANINRSVILDSLPSLYERLKQQGRLLVSGILTTDEELLLNKSKENNFKQVGIQRKNGWICVSFSK